MHNQSEIIYNILVGKYVTFGSLFKAQGNLPPLGAPLSVLPLGAPVST